MLLSIAKKYSVNIIGAGKIGSQLAFLTASSGFQTNLIDQNSGSLERAMDKIRAEAGAQLDSKNYDHFPYEALAREEHVMRQISTSTSIPRTSYCDFIFDCARPDNRFDHLFQITENMDSKSILVTVADELPKYALIIPKHLHSNVLGVQFLEPLTQNKLLEVVTWQGKTTNKTVRKFATLCHKMDKIPIPNENSSGLIERDILKPYVKKAFEIMKKEKLVRFSDVNERMLVEYKKTVGPFLVANLLTFETALLALKNLEEPQPELENEFPIDTQRIPI